MPYSLEQRRAFQQVMLHVRASSARVVGFTAADRGAGVTCFAEGFAALAGSVNIKTLLIAGQPAEPKGDWAEEKSFYSRPSSDLTSLSPYLGVFAADSSSFGEVGRTRQFVEEHRSSYELIVFDLPPVLGLSEVNPFSVGAVCDAVFLICRLGQTTLPRLARATRLMRQSQVNLVGVVANSYGYETPGQEIANAANRLAPIAPRLARWISRRALESDLMN